MPFRRATSIEDELHHYFQREKQPVSAKYLDPTRLGSTRTSGWKFAVVSAVAGVAAGIAMLQLLRRGRD